MFKFSQKPAFGLDLSDLSFKIIQLKGKKDKLSLASFLKEDLPAGLIEEGEIKQEAALVDFFKQALKKIKGEPLHQKRVICNLPEEKVFIRVIQMPRMKTEEMDQAVRWEAEAHIPLGIEDVYLDWRLLGSRTVAGQPATGQVDVLIAAAPKTMVDGYLSFLKKSGLEPVALEPESVAVVRSLLSRQTTNQPTMVIDLGATGTNFVICSSGIIRFTSHIRISGRLFNQVLVKTLKVDEKEANSLKIEVGLDQTQDQGAVYKALEPIVSDLAGQIKVYFNFYQEQINQAQGKDGEIAQILLCGGDSLLPNLPEFLSQQLNLPVGLGDPMINVLSAEKRKKATTFAFPGGASMSRRESFVFAIAIGLALRGFN